MQQVSVNFLAVFVAAIANMVVGSIWYAPPVFGKMWMKLLGKTEEDMKKGASSAPIMYALSFVFSLLMGYTLSHTIAYAGGVGVMGGLVGAWWIWFGFVMPFMAMEAMFSGKSKKLLALNVAHQLVSLLAIGAVIGAWMK